MSTRVERETSTCGDSVAEPGAISEGLVAQYRAVRQMSERLARPLSAEDCQIQSMPDASPVKWHLAHTSWFFETFVLTAHAPGYQPFHPSFVVLYNSYYNAVGARFPRPARGLLSRPSLEDVYAYRAAVDRGVVEYLESAGDALDPSVAAIVELGLNHEQQHQELIVTDIKHMLSLNPIHPAYLDGVAAPSSDRSGAMEWVSFDGGLRWLGHDGRGFAFDNEGPRHQVYVQEYQLASRLITNGEYLAFLADGGYQRPEFWLSDGWNAVNSQGWQAPLYWEFVDGHWWTNTLGGFRPVGEAEPVCHVSFYEADAFARWAGARLPTEAEWETAASSLDPEGNFLENQRFHPRQAVGGEGLQQCFGDVWEWTRSPYTPYPGSQPAAGALGEYNAKFMCNQLVLRGGSCATPASHIRSTYRNFFPPEARWQFTGIRLARD